MDINQRNIRIDAALLAAVKAGDLSRAEHAEACRLITAGEQAAITPSDAAQAPIYQVRTQGSLKWQDLEKISFDFYADEERYARRIVYTAPLGAQAPLTSIPLLAKDHTGMRVDYSGMFKQAQEALSRGSRSPAMAEMLRQLQSHITELGTRWYSGDTAVVDELLQLYCVEKIARDALVDAAPVAAQAPAAWMVLAANTMKPCEVTLHKSETEALRQDCVIPLYAAPAQQAVTLTDDAFKRLVAHHAALLDDNAHCYFELAYTRQTAWMAWITDRPAQGEAGTPAYAKSRKVIARGQGDTAEEACADALAALQSHSEGDQP